jgi:succinate dehydrogenase / fumarate reductase membrane anchor subunit
MDYRTPLAKARGLGSAHNGVEHWWLARISAILLIPLIFWLLLYVKQLLLSSRFEVLSWLAEPQNTFCAIAWIVAVFFHAALGMQVVIEDYIPAAGWKIFLIEVVKISCLLLGLLSILIVLKIFLAR